MSSKQVSLTDQFTISRVELITIIEDSFIDGWKKGHWSEWSSAEAFLEFYKEEGDSCETTTVLEGLRTGETDVD